MKILVTGFDPFGGESTNPAYEAVKALPDLIGTHTLIKMEVPTVFNKSIQVLLEAMKTHKPDVVICVGQAGGRAQITLERVAINIDDARITDNEGNAPIDLPVHREGPAAYFSNLPIKAMSRAIQMGGIPASVSNSAGTFVCNHIMYGLMHMIHTEFKDCRGGFIHVPYCEAQVVDKPNMPSMSLGSITKALEIAVEAAIEYKTDIHISEGAIF